MDIVLNPAKETDLHADFFAAHNAVLARLIQLAPGMSMRKGAAGTLLLATDLPVPSLNVVCPGPDPSLDPELEEVDAFARELSAAGVPWSIQLRGDAGPAMLALAARHGRTSTFTLPLLARSLGSLSALPASAPPGTAVREIPGSEREVFAAALASGYPMPKKMADVFALPAVLDAPDLTAFVLDRGGEAVATGFNALIGDQLGLYNGSVPPQHRRNGYYRALVTARLRHAVAAGARYAFTQNSPMSRPLYESLGFELVETCTYLTE